MVDKGPNPGNANLPIGARKIAIPADGNTRWHSRGYLPHFESPVATQHATFHLADSLPQELLRSLRATLEMVPLQKRDVERRRRLEAWVDAGYGSCLLRREQIAKGIQDVLLCFDAQRYRLIAWVIMPNHIHTLFESMNGWTVAKIVASWKKFAARLICDCLRECGETRVTPLWHREYWDRYIRDERHFWKAVEYTEMNPVKAGLVKEPEQWRWSSAYAGRRGQSKTQDANREIGVPRGWRTSK